MEFIDSERGNQKLKIKLKKMCGGQLSGGKLPRGLLSCSRFGLMVFNATFNNISAISWRTVLLVEETEILRENHRPVASH